MNINPKILNKILANQQYINKPYTMTERDLFQEYKDSSISANQWYITLTLKNQKNMITSKDSEKNPTPISD